MSLSKKKLLNFHKIKKRMLKIKDKQIQGAKQRFKSRGDLLISISNTN